MRMVLKNQELVHVEHGECIFVPQVEFSDMRNTNLNLMMQKGSRGHSDGYGAQKFSYYSHF